MAKEKGLEPLAVIIRLQMTKKSLEDEASPYVNEEKGVGSAKEAIEGAMDIIAEEISDDADYRTYIRDITMGQGNIVSEAKDDKAESVYENYYHFTEPVGKIAGAFLPSTEVRRKRCSPYLSRLPETGS